MTAYVNREAFEKAFMSHYTNGSHLLERYEDTGHYKSDEARAAWRICNEVMCSHINTNGKGWVDKYEHIAKLRAVKPLGPTPQIMRGVTEGIMLPTTPYIYKYKKF